MTLARLHRLSGLLALAAFLATGVYLRGALPEPERGNAWLHFASRANHIYILMASLVNLALAMYLLPRPRAAVQRAGSALVILAPLLLMAAFVREHATGELWRPLTMAGVMALALGVGLHALAGRPAARKNAPRPV